MHIFYSIDLYDVEFIWVWYDLVKSKISLNPENNEIQVGVSQKQPDMNFRYTSITEIVLKLNNKK